MENETLIQTALSRLIQNKTVLVIAHRMRTVAGADKIVVLERGMVAEEGTPGELLQKGGIYAHMEKRGSRYLRFALYNAAKYVCIWDPTFAAYLAKKRAEGKHYNVAISHAAKKLVRLIYAMEKSGLPYHPVDAA